VQGLFEVAALDQELLDVPTGGEGFTLPPYYDTTQAFISGQPSHGFRQVAPHGVIDGVKLVGIGKGDSGDVAFTADEDASGHSCFIQIFIGRWKNGQTGAAK